MNIAIDISPLETGHKVRGVGFYISNLLKALQEYYPEHNYTFFKKRSEIPNNTNILHYPYFDPFFLHLPITKKIATIVTIHDLIPLLFPTHFPVGVKGKVKWELQKFLVKQADAIITDSQASKNDIIEILEFPANNVHVVYLAADDAFRPLQITQEKKSMFLKQYNIPETFVMYVGDVTWNKNVPSIIEACQEKDIPLVLIGQALASSSYDASNIWNADLVKVEKLLRNNNKVFRLGFVPTDDLVILYNVASACVFPSLYEGFGLPVLEAMSCGCPVITSRKGSLTEVGGEACVYISPENVSEMSQAIHQLYSDPKTQHVYSEKGLKQAGKFNWGKTVKETVSVYSNVIKQYEKKNT